MDVVAAYRDVGTFRGAAAICGVDPKTVKRKVLAHEACELDEDRSRRAPVPKNTDGIRALVAERVTATRARMSAKRLLPAARAAGYTGSPRNFRRVVATEKKVWRGEKTPPAGGRGGGGRAAGGGGGGGPPPGGGGGFLGVWGWGGVYRWCPRG